MEHIGAPDDPLGIHYDLLLEDGHGCRTWRLLKIPVLDGDELEVIPLPVHNLEWLEKQAGAVSGGKGWAKRVLAGFFDGALPIGHEQPIQIVLHSSEVAMRLEIQNNHCKLQSI